MTINNHRGTSGVELGGVADIWDRMHGASFRLGRRGVMISAISGVDIAL
jgi:L-alanine-DL-glutamate epimerase-like enolase superfamily enzyme